MAKPTIDTPAYQGRATIHFHPGKHYYTVSIPGMKLKNVYQPGVTTVIGMKDKSGPLQWWTAEQCEAFGMQRIDELRGIMEENENGSGELRVVSLEFMITTLQMMKKNYRNVKKAAADVGSKAHDYLHAFLMWREFGGDHPLRPIYDPNVPAFTRVMVDQANASIDAGLDFHSQHEVKPLSLESPVWSPTYGYVGTDDFEGIVDGENVILDYKSGKRIYPEVWMQTAAYQWAKMEENPKKKYKARIAVNIGKDGKLDFQRRPNDEFFYQDFAAFRCLHGVYMWDRVHCEAKDHIQIVGPFPEAKSRKGTNIRLSRAGLLTRGSK